MENLGYIYRRTINLSDTDAAGVVYFANLLHICHEAYEYCLLELGFDWQQLLDAGEIAIPIVHADITCLKPIRWGDRLTVQLFPVIHLTKPSQFKIQYLLFKENSDILVAKGSTKHIAISTGDRQRCDFPEILEKWLHNAPKYSDPKT